MAALVRIANSAVLGTSELCCVTYVTTRHKSTKVTTTNYKRGTGGRSSFSGTVATVFGAKSALGTVVVNRLGKIGSQVIIPYRGDPYHVKDLKLMGDLGQILYNTFNLKDEDSVRRSIQYSNVVINLIGKEHDTRHFTLHETHVEGARRIARIARECGVEKLVHVSHLNAGKASNVFLQEGSEFLKTKHEGEIAVREEFPDAIIMRPANFIDLNDKFINYYTKWPRCYLRAYPLAERPVQNTLPLWKMGEETIKMPIRVTDVAQGIMNALNDPEAPGKTYQCVGPYAYKLIDLIEYVYESREKSVRLQDNMWPIRLKAMLREMMFKKFHFPLPYVTVDMLEKETVSDEINPNYLTLKDLGVQPKNIEELIEFMAQPFVDAGMFREKRDVYLKPDRPPKLYPTLV